MVVEFQKLHSNYLQSKYNSGLKSEGRINKLYPIGCFVKSSENMTDMCVVNNCKKTILTSSSNGLLSFKGGFSPKSIDKIYGYGKGIVNPRASRHASAKAVNRLAERAIKKHPILAKVFSNKVFQKALKLMNDNQLLSDAGIALVYTCLLRPASIAALPTKDKNEKEKNTYQIGHSISTGIIGFVTAFLIQTPIKHAIDKVSTAVASKNGEKYIQKSTELLFKKENIEKIRMLMERSHQPITLPLKACLTIYLVPKILKAFGLSKKPKTQNNVQAPLPYDAFKYFAAFKRNDSPFKNFAGGLNNASK